MPMKQLKFILLFLLGFTFIPVKAQVYSLQWQIPLTSPKNYLTDSLGNSYVVEGNLLKKYNPSGVFVWQSTVLPYLPVSIKFDNLGNLIAAGTTSTSTTLNDLFLYKIDGFGNIVWSRTLDSLNLNNNFTAFTIDKANNILLVGNTINTTNNSDVIIYKLNNNGVLAWNNWYSTTASGNIDYPAVVICDSLNNAYVVESIKSTGSAIVIDSIGILKYSPGGSLIKTAFRKDVPGYNVSVFPIESLKSAVIFNANIYVFYSYGTNLPGIKAAHYTCDLNLNYIGQKVYGGGYYYHQVTLVDVISYQNLGKLFVTGNSYISLSSTGPSYNAPYLSVQGATLTIPGVTSGCLPVSTGIMLPNGKMVYAVPNMCNSTLEFLLLNANGTISQTITTKPYSPSTNPTSFEMKTDKYNDVYVRFSNNTVSYLEKYALASGINEEEINSLILYPNPTAGEVKIETNAKVVSIELMDGLGRNIPVSINGDRINLNELQPGIYYVKLLTKEGLKVQKIIKD